MSFVVSEEIVNLWTILDTATPPVPVTGMATPADITFTLHRETGSTMEVATESITFAELGSTGHYSIAFTPDQQGTYVLQLIEVDAATAQRSHRFATMDVVAAGAVLTPTFVNAYCSQADISRWVQHVLSSATNPDLTEATAFAEIRANVLSSLVTGWGLATTPASVASGSRLALMLREANAIGAALDYVVSQEFGRSPNLTERFQRLEALWFQYVGVSGPKQSAFTGWLENEVKANNVALASDHVISGDTAARVADTPTPSEGDIGVGMEDLY